VLKKLGFSDSGRDIKVFTLILYFSDGGSRDLALKKALIYFVCKDEMPMSIVENEGFSYFVKTAVPKWKLPHRSTLTSWIEKTYIQLEDHTKQLIDGLDHYSVCADIWTEEHTTTSYLGVVLEYRDKEENCMKTIQLAMEPLEKPHEHEYIAEVMEKVLNKWGIVIEKTDVCITDNADNMRLAAIMVFGKNKWQPCFAHIINLLCADIMNTQKVKVMSRIH